MRLVDDGGRRSAHLYCFVTSGLSELGDVMVGRKGRGKVGMAMEGPF